MENFEIILMPIVGGMIGWLTNAIAIKMLFWPKKPIKIPLISWEFMGLLPKRHADLARSIGEIIERDLLPLDDLLVYFQENGLQDQLVDTIIEHVDKRIDEKLPRIIPQNIRQPIRHYVREGLGREIETMIGQIGSTSLSKLKSEFQLGAMVEEKVRSFDLDQLERLIKEVTNTELKYIEYLGGLFGFLIGCIQVLLLTMIK